MSHFVCLVVGEKPEEQLAPFSEELEVPEYQSEIVSEDDIQSFLNYYKKEKGDTGTFEEIYAKRGSDWNGSSWRKNEDGQLARFSTYNPKTKWDWYVLGGRYSGQIKLKEGAEGRVGRSGAFGNETGIDQALKGEIENLKELSAFSILHNGQWFERGEMGWWGIVINDTDTNEWNKKVTELLESLPDDTLISFYDLHI